ncbi:TlyA family RNA methyltransferase [uncultured Arthrobacter sp.]|uniref:TlyA family RNA methyltransferase n=1 Tax=uncultured Arthrobacter sp. TaxID=114050 RepID=UPI0025DFF841|nr:TlyA family RNA methyltransferase [uncultured Arthrobacter sp.]
MARLDQELVSRGLARSRSHAAQLIAARRVFRAGEVMLKASAPVSGDQELAVADAGPEFVSRAGHKLAGALSAFPGVAVAGRRCLDAGASTGGFTDVLLRAGAREVAAVDVGHGQLVQVLREDPRVHVFEGLNVRYLDSGEIGGPAELTVADLSFISLKLVIRSLAAATVPGGDLVLMIKPQFEVGRGALNGQGVVTSGAARRRGVHGVIREALAAGLEVRGLEQSSLPGQDGNLEYFLWVRVPHRTMDPRIEEDLDRLTDGLLSTSAAFGGRAEDNDGAE